MDSSGNPLAYHTDGLGSVRALTDASGNVVTSSGSVSQPFGYAGSRGTIALN